MKISARLVKAFTTNKEEGNPAGVVLDADSLSKSQMLKIAKTIGFSETAFVTSSKVAAFKVRFFTPKQEVDFCGHAIIAAFHTLLEQGKIKKEKSVTTMQETKAGILPVTIYADGRIVMAQKKPEFLEIIDVRTEIAKLLGLPEKDLGKWPLQIVSTGTPKLLIPINTLEALLRIKPNLEGIIDYCKKTGARGFYSFTSETKHRNSDFHTRQFNPLAGIDEDPVTGVAAGALGAYIAHHKLSKKTNFIVEQGHCLNKPGKIFVNIKRDEIKVGGYAVTFGEKTFEA